MVQHCSLQQTKQTIAELVTSLLGIKILQENAEQANDCHMQKRASRKLIDAVQKCTTVKRMAETNDIQPFQ